MDYLNITEVERKVNELSEMISTPGSLLPTFGFSTDLGHPHVEVDDRGYHYIVIERGTEVERRSSGQLFDLLYWIFRDITFSMAVRFEVENRIDGQDFRRLVFEKQLELISKVDVEFRSILNEEIKRILVISPYQDKKKS